MHLKLSILLLCSLFISSTTASHFSGHQHGAILKRKRNWNVFSNRSQSIAEDPAELQKRDGTKYVFMHHIVGNTYPYTYSDWLDDINRIAAKGIDAIALNIGSDDWQRTQVSSAYAAAQASGTGIKLFYSFDLTEMPCDLNDLVARVNLYRNHPNQFKVNGKTFISSYSGDCLGNSGWQSLKDQTNGYIMPFMWGLEGSFGSWPSLDSWYCWGCAWPQGNYDKNTNDDNFYISQLGSKYATTISGWMYAHLASKNFYLRGDDWLIVSRWEQLMQLRSTLTFAEMVTWNDYGESDYFGPIKGAQPDGTTYANGFPHTAWFDLSKYYIQAFQTGIYPAITSDVIYFWARPHPASATASGDSLGKPTGWDWTEDSMWAVVFATSPATVILKCGSSSSTFSVSGGVVTKLKIPLSPGQMTVQMIRNSQTIINYTPSDFTYVTNPVLYNYNAWVGSATASASATSSASSTTSSASSTTSSASSTTSSSATSSSATSSSATSSSTTTTSTSTSSSSTPTTTAGWTYQGCYVDASTRILPDFGPYNSNTMSISTCLTRCSARGYMYAGVEDGNECFCSNTITVGSSPTTPSDCATPCVGQATDTCGGAWRINIYKFGTSSTTTTAPTPTTTISLDGWSYKGCYVDSSARVLPDSGPVTSDQMSIGMCLAGCQSQGYLYGGVENGNECWCSNTLKSGSAPTTENDCSTPCTCPSTPNDICGGSWRINVYQFTATTSSGTTTTTTTTTTTSTSTTPTTTTTTTTTSASSSRSTTTTTSASSSRSTTTTASSTSSSTTSSRSTTTTTTSASSSRSSTTTTTTTSASSSRSSTTTTTSTSPTTTSGTVSVKSPVWNSVGCVAEGTTGSRRALTAASFSGSNMTPQACQALCSGYQYSGVEASSECYCGNSLTNNGATGTVINSSNCQWACSGDASQKCGGSWTLNVYKKSTTTTSTTWSSAGCFVDSDSRMLQGLFSSQPGSLTVEGCTTLCQTAGYTMAAMEYGQECYCGSQLNKAGGAGVAVGAGQCNMPCSGNSAELCGAGWRGNLYLKAGTTLS